MKDDFKEIQTILFEKLNGWYEGLISYLPNMVAAILVLIIFWIISLIAKRATKTTLSRITANETIIFLVTSLTKIFIVLTGLFFALGILDLQKTITSLLAGAGIVGLAIGFAFQDMATNFLAGFYMGIRQPIKPGDLIETKEFFGTVTQMGLRNTTIRDFNGQYVLIPNAQIFENPIINYTMTSARRIDIPFGITYDADIEKAQSVVEDSLSKLDFVLQDDDYPIHIVAIGFGGSSVDLEARYWISTTGKVIYPIALSEGIKAVKRALDDADIVIPFPIRTLAFNHETKDMPPFKLLDYQRKQAQANQPEESDTNEEAEAS